MGKDVEAVSNLYVAERSFKSEERIKKKILEYRERGVCDRNGGSLRKGHRGYASKTDRPREYDQEVYEKNYAKIDWSDPENRVTDDNPTAGDCRRLQRIAELRSPAFGARVVRNPARAELYPPEKHPAVAMVKAAVAAQGETMPDHTEGYEDPPE